MSGTRQPDDLYFVNPWVDSLCIGAASFFVFLWYRLTHTGYGASQVAESAIMLAGALTWVGNWPHFSATAMRLYGSRANLSLFALTAWLAPALLVLATVACFVFPVSFAPSFIKLFVFWSPYHFSAQTLGITLIYLRRAGVRVSPRSKHALWLFVMSSFLVQYTATEITLQTAFMYFMAYPQLNLPSSTSLYCEVVMYASIAFFLYDTLPHVLKLPRLPWIAAVPLLTQYLWFVHGVNDFSFQLLVPFFHAVQYLMIAWSARVREAAAERRTFHLAEAVGVSARWTAVNVALGGAILYGIPRILSHFGFELDFSILMIAAAISIHHYFVDGVIWKLRQEKERSPLFTNVAWAFQQRETSP